MFFCLVDAKSLSHSEIKDSIAEIESDYSEYLNEVNEKLNYIETKVSNFENGQSYDNLLNIYKQLNLSRELPKLPKISEDCNFYEKIEFRYLKGMDPYYLDKFDFIYKRLHCLDSVINITQWKEISPLRRSLESEADIVKDRILYLKKLEAKRNKRKKLSKFIESNSDKNYSLEEYIWSFRNR